MVAPTTDSSSAEAGIVFDIQRASLHDGPGLRTTVFLKGCPLRCGWCHNPESQKMAPQKGQSGKVYGKRMSVDAVMEVVEADRNFYQHSGGGLTISGGEPTLQFEFCRELLLRAHDAGIHTCLDTSGQFPPERLEVLIPLVDLWHFDLKLTDPTELQLWTGADAHTIRRNLAEIEHRNCAIVLRCPIIPTVNDTAEHEAALEELERSGRFVAVERLPYHTTGNAKYSDLNLLPPNFRVLT